MTGEPAAEAVAAPAAVGPAGADGLAVEDLATRGAGPVSLAVRLGERVGLYGLEGSGCSAVLEALFGLRPATGRVSWRGAALAGDPRRRIDAGLGFVSGDRGRTLIGPWSVAMNHGMPRLGALSWAGRLDRRTERRDAARAVARLAVKGAPNDPLRTLSGGNQQKVAIGRWLERSGVCLLADEPTRGVDVRGRAAIHQLLAEFCREGNTLLVRSTDPDELVELCDRVLVMVDGRVTRALAGPALTTDALEAATRTAGRAAFTPFPRTA
jgi:ABC-type sugar transport system ATPase subunit